MLNTSTVLSFLFFEIMCIPISTFDVIVVVDVGTIDAIAIANTIDIMTSWANGYGFIEGEGDAPSSWTEMVTVNSSAGAVAGASPETIS